MVAKFDPNDIRLDWKELQDNVGVLLKHAGKGVASIYLYWSNPGLYWAVGGISIPMAHAIRETTSKVIDVWKEHKGWTFSLICLSSFLSLPSTIFAMTFIVGAHTGSELSIEAGAMKAIKVYQQTIGNELTDGQKDAFFQFLCKDRNLLYFDSFQKHVTSAEQAQNKEKNKTKQSLRNEAAQLWADHRKGALEDFFYLEEHMIFPNVVNHVIETFSKDILASPKPKRPKKTSQRTWKKDQILLRKILAVVTQK